MACFARCVLVVVCWLLCVGCCVLVVVCCVSFGGSCLLIVACCALVVVSRVFFCRFALRVVGISCLRLFVAWRGSLCVVCCVLPVVVR